MPSSARTRSVAFAASLAALGFGGGTAAQGELPPCLLEEARLHASDEALDDHYGWAVAFDGTTIAVGSPDDDFLGYSSGAVYLYEKEGDGWVERQKLLASDGGEHERFGASLAIQGGTLVVGAPGRLSSFTSSPPGAAYVFVRAGDGWVEQAKLRHQMPFNGDSFGHAVDLDGDRAIVTTPRDSELAGNAGAAFVFERTDGAWVRTTKLLAGDGAQSDSFGRSVALQGAVAVVGAPFHDELGSSAGAVYAFVEAGGTWVQEQKIVGAETEASDQLGAALDLDGERLAVGAPGRASIHVFEREGGAWIEVGSPLSGSNVGEAVRIEGDRIVAGATGTNQFGAARLFGRDAVTNTWAELQRLVTEVDDGEQDFGYALGMAGGVVVVGGPFYDSNDVGFGAAWVFSPAGPFEPTVAFRNAGTNPVSYGAGPAAIGEHLQLTVAPFMTGHEQALVIGFDSPFELTLGSGQTLLCADLGGHGELINTGFRSGPVVEFSVYVPYATSLLGFRIRTQAVHAFGPGPFALSNAQDIVIGGCP